MMWYTHLAFAILLFLVIKVPLKWPWLAIIPCAIAALIPDIDHRDSKISRKLPITSRLVELFFNHRGIVHSLFAAVAFTMLVFFATYSFNISQAYAYAFFVGYASHLMMDSLNPAGIAWLRPFYKRRARSVIRTGGIAELLVFAAISGLIALNLIKIF